MTAVVTVKTAIPATPISIQRFKIALTPDGADNDIKPVISTIMAFCRSGITARMKNENRVETIIAAAG